MDAAVIEAARAFVDELRAALPVMKTQELVLAEQVFTHAADTINAEIQRRHDDGKV